MSDPQTDALVQAAYPIQWERANSKKRNQLRKRYQNDLELRRLRTAGASCRTCAAFKPYPMSLGGGHAHICEADSDFHGYAVVQPDWLCTRWSAADARRDTESRSARSIPVEDAESAPSVTKENQ